jgi:DNA polymerase
MTTTIATPEPRTIPLSDLEHQAGGCRRCELWRQATRLVFGEGREHVAMMLVGEQPGDREDLAGRPFVGPVGRLLDEALVEAGIVRDDVYVTNAVKHFKFVPRGRRRIHAKPSAGEIDACRRWLDLELMPDPDAKARERTRFVTDLRVAHQLARSTR